MARVEIVDYDEEHDVFFYRIFSNHLCWDFAEYMTEATHGQ